MGDAKRRGTYEERKAAPTGIINMTPRKRKVERIVSTANQQMRAELVARMKGRR